MDAETDAIEKKCLFKVSHSHLHLKARCYRGLSNVNVLFLLLIWRQTCLWTKRTTFCFIIPLIKCSYCHRFIYYIGVCLVLYSCEIVHKCTRPHIYQLTASYIYLIDSLVYAVSNRHKDRSTRQQIIHTDRSPNALCCSDSFFVTRVSVCNESTDISLWLSVVCKYIYLLVILHVSSLLLRARENNNKQINLSNSF